MRRALQVGAVIVIEMRKILGGRRAVPAYLLAGLPVAVILVMKLAGAPFAGMSLSVARGLFANTYVVLVLGATVFFGCALVFTNLFRGEILRRSLHFYLLAPIRREVLTVAKYLAGTIALFAMAGTATVLVHVLAFGVLFNSAGAVHDAYFVELANYLGVTLLGCTAYGAVFLLFGTLFRNPVFPVAGLFAWEAAIFLMPAELKVLGIGHHLRELLPVPSMPQSAWVPVLESPPATWAVPSLLLVSVAAVALACWRVRRIQVSYSED